MLPDSCFRYDKKTIDEVKMEKAHAIAILRSAYSFDDHIGAISARINLLENGEEKERIRKAIEDVMRIVAIDIILPTTKQHPDLDLDK